MLTDLLRAHRDDVLEVARTRLAEMTPGRAALDPGYLPSLLDRLAADFEQGQTGSAQSGVATEAVGHGRWRQRHGVELRYIAHDYGVVCDAISEIALRTTTTIDASEWQKLNRALDMGIANAIASYDEVRRDDERQTTAVEMGSLAHELRNALAAASTAFEAVRKGHVGTESRTADIVLRNLKRAAALASDLLVDSKVAGGAPLLRRKLLVRPLTEDIVAGLPVGGEVVVRVDVGAEGTAYADEQLLTSALTNVVQNALKFTRRGGQVVIRALLEDDATVIEVEDECGGLPPGLIEMLFQPFVQRGADRSGVGLGLTIVRKVMTAHGGAVSARDLPGQGCVFVLRFPAGPKG